jgi:hypothetical protein
VNFVRQWKVGDDELPGLLQWPSGICSRGPPSASNDPLSVEFLQLAKEWACFPQVRVLLFFEVLPSEQKNGQDSTLGQLHISSLVHGR